ncbi:putative DNase [Escherichia coli DEC10D]|nr:putative DNase [Escherichia coli DEC10D]
MPGSAVSVVVWLTSVTVNSITELHFSSVVVMRRRISGRSVPNAIDKSLLVKRRVGMPDPTLPEVSGGHGRADDIIGL